MAREHRSDLPGHVRAVLMHRATVESIDSCQSTCPAWSAVTSNAAMIWSHVPSLLNRAWRFHTVCQGPNLSGRSRHGHPVRNRNTMSSMTCR